MKKMAILLVAAFSFLFSNVATAFPPLPDDLNIVQPNPSLPKELVAFSGKWAGTMFVFGRTIKLFLIVERIEETEARLYLYGTSEQWERTTGEVVKERGKYRIYFQGSKGTNILSFRKGGKYLDLSFALESFTATFERA